MTTGDFNKFSTKAVYKGIQMRSILETKVACFLDALSIKWQYEPKAFTLSTGLILIPDFYLTELDMWIEAKGDLNGANKDAWKQFTIENNTEIMLLNGKEALWFSTKDFKGGFNEDNWILIGKCSSCKSFFFTSNCSSCKSFLKIILK
jgi:hypothetical protein